MNNEHRVSPVLRAQVLAFNEGVLAVLAIAEKSAKALDASSLHSTRKEFAVSALSGLAEAGQPLLLETSTAGNSRNDVQELGTDA